MPDDLSLEVIEGISEALAKGSKIEAIKIHRQHTNQGLKESKAFIEALIPRLVEEDPTRYDGLAKGGSGCAGVLLAGVMLGAVVGTLFSGT